MASPLVGQLHLLVFALIWTGRSILAKSPRISDLRSQISGVEELLEEFRKQLQQEQEEKTVQLHGDVCIDSFSAMQDYIIRAKDSIEAGATFLTAPADINTWKECLHACCADPHCTVAVVELRREVSQSSGLSCFLFNCTYRNRNVCRFSSHPGYNSYALAFNGTLYSSGSGTSADGPEPSTSKKEAHVLIQQGGDRNLAEKDAPPQSNAGDDVVVQLPTDWVILDGRESTDDHGIARYEWTLLQGDRFVTMKAPQPGILKLTDLKEGIYHFQLTVTDTENQKSLDNVTVTVLPQERRVTACTGLCSRYKFMCDDGCCIDITFACDGTVQCADSSDEAFCQNFDGGRKAVTHASGSVSKVKTISQSQGDDTTLEAGNKNSDMERLTTFSHPYDSRESESSVTERKTEQDHHVGLADLCMALPDTGPCKGIFSRWYFDASSGKCQHFIYGGCKGNQNNFLQEIDCISRCVKEQGEASLKNITGTTSVSRTEFVNSPDEENVNEKNKASLSKAEQKIADKPLPESGAVLPLALGLAITALLLLMAGCRLRLVRQKLKKARPITSEESDYLINGMYL
ncbi:low-density lipoprotein receptor-related protein 11 isoform X1 [Polypterus senegalus]|uniref:low-density lipoprotein receptor-related protein 11 isoform X1 n=1 Tax=Polypterus senegalus TaxID=55291 RepID=UPI001963BEA9|nr:low-density lipoprotein receptor-related protein 11 isoform X1 [Polypterus senegalus]